MEGEGIRGAMKPLRAWFADWLIMRSLRSHFRGVYLLDRDAPDPARPLIVFANHHYWWDGYLLHLFARHWRPGQSMVWMRELTSFPPFEAIGAMPFPEDDPIARAATLKRTLRALRSGPSLLFLFPEGDMHPAPHLAPFRQGLHWLHSRLPEVDLKPVAIHIEQGIHQHPEAYIIAGPPYRCDSPDADSWLAAARGTIADMLDELAPERRPAISEFTCILAGRLSTDEYRCSGNRERGPKPVEGEQAATGPTESTSRGESRRARGKGTE